MKGLTIVAAAAALAATLWLAAGAATLRGSPYVSAGESGDTAMRDDALRRARVMRAAAVPTFDFSANPPDPSGLLSRSPVECQFVSGDVGGTTPKFNCALADGEIVKVKYGRNPEIQAEAAGTRLLTGLGFGADRIYIVPRVRCRGCPPLPFQTTRLFGFVHAARLPEFLTPDSRVAEYEWVAIERRMEGTAIEAAGESGWGWYEFAPDADAGGATRAEADAFRLVAAFLAHWDNKAENQRLVCLDDPPAESQPCRSPFAIVQDLGATFGPHKVNLQGWRGSPVWTDRAACGVGMRHLPFLGGTFQNTRISEAGRRLLARRLTAMSRRQIAALFAGARFGEYEKGRWFGPAAHEEAWVDTFQDRVRQVAEGAPCPPI